MSKESPSIDRPQKSNSLWPQVLADYLYNCNITVPPFFAFLSSITFKNQLSTEKLSLSIYWLFYENVCIHNVLYSIPSLFIYLSFSVLFWHVNINKTWNVIWILILEYLLILLKNTLYSEEGLQNPNNLIFIYLQPLLFQQQLAYE